MKEDGENSPDVPHQGSITTTVFTEARESEGLVLGKEDSNISLFAQP